MATVYSLICWAGRVGKSVTANSSTDYVTLSNHGLRNSAGVAFTGGTLPTVSGAALALNTTYYAKNISSSTYELYYDAALTNKINFTSNGSGLGMKSAYFLGLSSDQRARYGAAGSERVYDGLHAWNTARAAAAQTYDTEVCEIGEAFDDTITSPIVINIPCASTLITTKVAGANSAGWHGGSLTAGYALTTTSAFYDYMITVTGYRTTLSGIRLRLASNYLHGVMLRASRNTIRGCIVHSTGTFTDQYGINSNGSAHTVQNNIAVRIGMQGFRFQEYAGESGVYTNNLAAKCGTGFYAGLVNTAVGGWWYNNVSVGNTTNWGLAPTTNAHGAGYNFGQAGDTPWFRGADTGIKNVTASNATFVDWTNDDFRPVAGGPLVDKGVTALDALSEDLRGDPRPSYNNGGAEAWDGGPFEYDNGYGTPPASGTLAGTNIANGTRIKIAKRSDGAEVLNAVVSGTSRSDAYTGPNLPVYVYARKGSAAPFYKPVRLAVDILDGSLAYDLAGLQIEDIARGASYPSSVATDWSFNASTGAVAHNTGSTIYTVQDLYSYYRDYTDDITTVSDPLLMDGSTPTVFKLINNGNITTADLRYLKGGSVEYQDGTLWSNVYSVGTLAGSPDIYLYQNGSKLTSFWPADHLDVLIKVANAGTLIDAGRIAGYVRKWGYTYDNYEADLSGGGRSVMPLATAIDPAITQSVATVASWSDVTVSFGSYSLDFADGDGAKTYYARINCNGRPLSEVYQRMQYLTREGQTATLNGVPGERYASAHASVGPIKAAPFGIYSGGIWSLAQGVWLDNVGSGDLYNFVLTDAAGDTHQNVVALFQSVTVAGLTIGSRVQIYDTTNDLELFNGIATAASVAWEDTAAPAGDRAIRLRAAYVSGGTAKNFIEAFIGTCGTASGNKDVSYLVSQTPDAVYNANAIDGSTVTGVTFTDASTDTMNIAIDAGQVNLGQLYAAWVWYAFSEAGIATDIDYIHAIDQANYVYTNLRWKNTTSPAVPLKITGGYAWDSVTEDPTDLVDVTGGTVFLTPPHVVAKTITVTGGNVITGDVGDLPTAAQVASAVLAAATSAPIHADTKRMNGANVLGAGTAADKWRGE